jgi:hypothetical protein
MARLWFFCCFFVEDFMIQTYENEPNKNSHCCFLSGAAGFNCHPGTLDELFPGVAGRTI